MALQHARSLLFRGEDLGFGSGSPKEIIVPTVVAGSARALNAALGFSVSSTQLTAVFSGTGGAASGVAGLNRMVVNRSTRFFVTLQGTLNNATSGQGSVAVHIPIPPLGMAFLPCTFVGPVTVVANSTMPSTLPVGNVVPVPTAGSNVLTVEALLEA